jgi:phosphopantetheine--protein transferase-like protein
MNVVPVNVTPRIGRLKPCAAGAPWQPPRVLRRYRALADLGKLLRDLDEDWLSPREQLELEQWRDARRRSGWLMSRVMAKHLLGETAGATATDFEILSRDALGRVNRPLVWRQGDRLPWSLSISHSDRGVLVALAPSDEAAIGVDLTQEQAFSQSVAETWFTAAELAWYRQTNSRQIGAYIWSAKEALYKALSDGESFAPLEFEVLADGQCRHRGRGLSDCRVQSWTVDGHLAVLAVARLK